MLRKAFTLASVVAFLASACQREGAPEGGGAAEPIVLGYVGDFSEIYAYYDQPLLDGARFAIEEINAAGGVLGRPLELLTRAGARDIRLVCIVAAPEGIAAVERVYPRVPIFTPVVDERLNDHKFIVPGLGDFGDRLYGT